MGPANSLHASVQYSEYNERFDLIEELATFDCAQNVEVYILRRMRKSIKGHSKVQKNITFYKRTRCLVPKQVH